MSASTGHNSINSESAKRFFGEIIRTQEQLDEEQLAYMARCKDIRERRTELLESADNAGVPKKALKAKFKQWIEDRRIKQAEARKLAAIPDDSEDRDTFDALCAALGDFGELPLGAAALEKAASDDDKDIRPGFLKDRIPTATIKIGDGPEIPFDGDRVAQNIKRLRSGIKAVGLPGADANEA